VAAVLTELALDCDTVGSKDRGWGGGKPGDEALPPSMPPFSVACDRKPIKLVMGGCDMARRPALPPPLPPPPRSTGVTDRSAPRPGDGAGGSGERADDDVGQGDAASETGVGDSGRPTDERGVSPPPPPRLSLPSLLLDPDVSSSSLLLPPPPPLCCPRPPAAAAAAAAVASEYGMSTKP